MRFDPQKLRFLTLTLTGTWRIHLDEFIGYNQRKITTVEYTHETITN